MTNMNFRRFGETMLLITSIFTGMSMIMGINATSSAPSFMLNYYKYLKKSDNVVAEYPKYWSQILTFYNCITEVVQTIMEPLNLTRFLSSFSLLFRLEVGSLLMILELMIILLLPQSGQCSEVGAIVGTMVCAVLGGVGRGLFQNTVFALFGSCPSHIIGGAMLGVPVSGALVSALQIILLASMPDDYDSTLTRSVIYFSTALGIIFICGVLVILLLFNSFAKKYVAELRSKRSVWENIYCPVKAKSDDAVPVGDLVLRFNQKEEDAMKTREPYPINTHEMGGGNGAASHDHPMNATRDGAFPEQTKCAVVAARESEEDEMAGAGMLTSSEMLQAAKLWPIFKVTFSMNFSCFFCFVVSFLMFPGVLIAIDNDAWFMTLIVATYNCGDLCGRLLSMCKWLRFSRKAVLIASIARVIFIPLLILCAVHKIPGHAPAYVLAALLGVSGGFFSTLSMIHAPTTPGLKTEGERATASQICDSALLLGCSVGCLSQLAVVIPLH